MSFEELVHGMKNLLRDVYPKIKQVGNKNAKLSKHFLAIQVPELEHVLKSLIHSPALNPEIVRKLEELDQRIKSRYSFSSVRGRAMEMKMMSDGTTVPAPKTRQNFRQYDNSGGTDGTRVYFPAVTSARSSKPAATNHEFDYLFEEGKGVHASQSSAEEKEAVKEVNSTAKAIKLDWPRAGP